MLDEINISAGTVFDVSTNTYIGRVTLPGHNNNDIATNVLVFMLASIEHRWKQTMAYYYTAKNTNGSVYKNIILEIIQKAEKIGLRIQRIVSDMGSANQAMWREFNINISRHSVVKNKCVHSYNETRHLYFFHDSSHALKNFKEGMLNHKYITIPKYYIEKYNLPTNTAHSAHFIELSDYQKNVSLHLAPKLRPEYFDRSSHFIKMRVKSSFHVMSHAVSTSLQFLATEKLKPEYQTTSWLVGQICKYFLHC